MTKHWGPLGWMTLHSISINYPQNPSAEDKAVLDRFIEKFGDCITCNNCKTHFQNMLSSYKRKYPQWSSSQRELFLFVCRAHNTVNKRIDKPIISSVSDCLESIKNNSRDVSLRQFRATYANYLITNWSKYHDFDGMHAKNAAREVEKINNSYWNLREVDISDIEVFDADVTEFISDTGVIKRIGIGFPNIQKGQSINVGFKIRGGKFSLIGR